jgi:excisionase family DNA binding protein
MHDKPSPALAEAVKAAETALKMLAVNAAEAAKMLGISPRLLWTMTNMNEIPHVRLGRRILYQVSALERWLSDRTQGGDLNA